MSERQRKRGYARLRETREAAQRLKRDAREDGSDECFVIIWLAYDGRYDVVSERAITKFTNVVEYA